MRRWVLWFQFHTGSIKRSEIFRRALDFYGFNSILVRLKVEPAEGHVPVALFQFHTGSIKRVAVLLLLHRCRLRFNSILVRLKEIDLPSDITVLSMFQFHTGSIKSWPLYRIILFDQRFNSILVRLKDRGNKHETSHIWVSIPYWFD